MNKNSRSIVIYIIVAVVIITGYIGLNAYRYRQTSTIIEDTLQKYFESNNSHISSHNFKISDIKIKCSGNSAYLVEFSLLLDDNDSSEFNRLGATIYKNKGTWLVKGFGNGLTKAELKQYNFKCYN